MQKQKKFTPKTIIKMIEVIRSQDIIKELQLIEQLRQLQMGKIEFY